MKTNTIAIIPARGGSKGVPRKNIRLLAGKPLIAYSIEVALKSKLIDRVLVSTEDNEIAEIAAKFGAEVIKRPQELARDNTPSLPVFQHVIRYLDQEEGYHPETIVVLQPTSPLRTEEDIEQAMKKLSETNCDAVVSVCDLEHPPDWMYVLDGDKLKYFIRDENRVHRRQDAAKVYRSNGAIYITRRDVIIEQNSLFGKDTRAILMPPERSIDIDSEIDLELAELLIKKSG
ncbi:cytidylyltransferase domain-containing protein [Chloroflexota bacterium]